MIGGKISVQLQPNRRFTPDVVVSENPRVYIKVDSGYLEFNFTQEGIIVDHWYENDASEEICDTFSMTYGEFIEEIINN